jgi:hypothetical protein
MTVLYEDYSRHSDKNLLRCFHLGGSVDPSKNCAQLSVQLHANRLTILGTTSVYPELIGG